MANRATGAVKRLFVSSETHIRLQIPAAEQPKDSYLDLERSHVNYDALYSLALSAAVDGYPLSIKTYDQIDPTKPAKVSYLVVDW